MIFSTQIADCPWSPDDALGKRGAAANYDVMSIHDLCVFPQPPLARNAYLFFWRLASMQHEALRVVDAWGFIPKAELVWNKLTRTGKPWFGLGRHTRAAHETCIIATRGRPKPLARNIRSTFSAKVPSEIIDGKLRYVHSRKPDEFYEIVERLAPGPYVELFARRERGGLWTHYGNELAVAHP